MDFRICQLLQIRVAISTNTLLDCQYNFWHGDEYLFDWGRGVRLIETSLHSISTQCFGKSTFYKLNNSGKYILFSVLECVGSNISRGLAKQIGFIYVDDNQDHLALILPEIPCLEYLF